MAASAFTATFCLLASAALCQGMRLPRANEFEWGGTFAVADSSHKWLMQKVGGKYVDPSMKLVIFPTTTPDKKTMEAHEAKGDALMEGTCTDVQDKGTIKPVAAGSCFNLVVGAGDDSSYTIDTTGLTGIVVFAQHVPTEFERDMHYLKDAAGKDIEPTAQEGADGHAHGHGEDENAHSCACEAEEFGFKIDCTKKDAIAVRPHLP